MRNIETGLFSVSLSIENDLKNRETSLRKEHIEALADLSATVLQTKSVNTSDWIAALPRDDIQKQSKERYILRFLANGKIEPSEVMGSFVTEIIRRICSNGSTVVLMLDQSKISEGRECLMLSLRFGNRALPVLWKVVETKGAIGFDFQKGLLDKACGFIPKDLPVLFTADRFYGTSSLIEYCQSKKWGYRIRLKGNMRFRHDDGDISPAEAYGLGMKGCENAVFANTVVSTNIGILHEKGHPEPWYIAMSVKPTEYRTLDYGMRWGIESMFSDFKSRGFGITDTQLTTADRIERLILILSVAMYRAVSTGLSPDDENKRYTKKNSTGRLSHISKKD